MKRTLSLVLVVSMLLSMVAIAPFYSSAATLDEYNVGTEAYYYGGSVQFSKLTGTNRSGKNYTWDDPLSIKDGDASKGSLLINGKIDEGEWGNPSFVVSKDYAASNDGLTDKQNIADETPSAENSYFYYNKDNYPSPKTPMLGGMSYSVYLMWDEAYLYIAADVYDASGHSNNGTKCENIWNGDSFQFRVDKDGPNSSVDGSGYNADGGLDEDKNHVVNYPWKTSVRKGGVEFTSEVPNMVVAYTHSNDGLTIVTDNANRYYPHDVEVDDPDSDDENDKILEKQWCGVEVSYEAYTSDLVTDYETYKKEGGCAVEVKEWGPVYAVACPQKIGTTGAYQTQYEIAVPWDYIDDAEDFLAEAGLELGLSTMVIDRQASAAKSYGAFLEWGSGINNHRSYHDYQTCGGSNSLILSATNYNDRDDYHEHSFAAATCIAPETCTICGYERGYKTGHKYQLSGYKLPTESEAGSASAVCTVCGDNTTRTMAASEEKVYKGMSRTDGAIDLKQCLSSAFSVAWTHHTWTKTKNEDGTTDWSAEDGAVVYNTDGENAGASKNMLWLSGQTRPAIDDDVTEMVNPYGFTVLDMTCMSQTGTYFHLYDFHPKNYAVNMQVDLWARLTADEENKEGETGYNDCLAFWFGEKLIEYAAGLFIIEDKDKNGVVTDTQAFFAITGSGNYDTAETIESFKKKALAYKEVDLEEFNIEQGKWNQMTFVADFDANVALLFWDGEYVVGAYDYHFARPEGENHSDPIIRLMNLKMCVTDLQAGNTSIAANYVTTSGEYDVPVVGPETTVPDSETTTPDSETTTPDSETTTPDSETTTPDSETTTPDSETAAPEEVALETNMIGSIGAFVQKELEAGNEGQWYKTVAPADGKLYIDIQALDADNNNIGWKYVVNNVTACELGEMKFSGADEYYGAEELNVKAGDEITVFVSTYDPENADNAPAGIVSVNFGFSGVGSWDNPADVKVGSNSAPITAGSQGYYYEWTADKKGTITVSMDDDNLNGWSYSINVVHPDYTGIYGDTHNHTDEVLVSSESVDVEVGDVVTIYVNTYNPDEPWSAPEGTVDWRFKFMESIDIDTFGLIVTGEEIDGQYHVYYNIVNNPGIWSIAADLSYNTDALELVEVNNGAIFTGEGEYTEVDPVNGTHRYFANGEDKAFGDITENGLLVEYVFNIKDASKRFLIDVKVDARDVFNCELVNQELTLINTLEEKLVNITIDGVAAEYVIGEEVTFTADKLVVVDGVGYVFEAWVVDGVEMADTAALEITFTVPANDVVIEKKTFIHGDTDGNGSVDAVDLLTMCTAVKAGECTPYVDVDFDGEITALDLLNECSIIKGTYEY